VCGSDLALLHGKRPADYPLILGHEAIGHVAQPASSALEPGARVVIEPNVPCGRCAVCARGKGNVCADKRSLGLNAPGVFAELVAIPSSFVHRLPDELAACDAVFVEPLAVAVHAVSISQATAGEVVAVIGCGTQGLLLCQVALAMGAQVVAADVRAESLAAARLVGVHQTIHIDAQAPLERQAAVFSANGPPTVVFEAAGAAHAVELAIHAAARAGRVVLVGLAAQTVPLLPLRFVRRGLTLLGSLIYDHPTDFEHSIDLLRSRRVQPSALIGRVARLENVADVLRMAGPGKVLLDLCAAR
jgi:threonine dehydrogenase-like Zn-dependent dehydrogenase